MISLLLSHDFSSILFIHNPKGSIGIEPPMVAVDLLVQFSGLQLSGACFIGAHPCYTFIKVHSPVGFPIGCFRTQITRLVCQPVRRYRFAVPTNRLAIINFENQILSLHAL